MIGKSKIQWIISDWKNITSRYHLINLWYCIWPRHGNQLSNNSIHQVSMQMWDQTCFLNFFKIINVSTFMIPVHFTVIFKPHTKTWEIQHLHSHTIMALVGKVKCCNCAIFRTQLLFFQSVLEVLVYWFLEGQCLYINCHWLSQFQRGLSLKHAWVKFRKGNKILKKLHMYDTTIQLWLSRISLPLEVP